MPSTYAYLIVMSLPVLPPLLQRTRLARYLAKYVVSPPISLRRIDRYDGHRVTYHYRSHKSERVERETVDVYTFVGRMVPQCFPKAFNASGMTEYRLPRRLRRSSA